MSKRTRQDQKTTQLFSRLFSIRALVGVIALYLRLSDRKSHSKATKYLDLAYHAPDVRKLLKNSDLTNHSFSKNLPPEFKQLFAAVRNNDQTGITHELNLLTSQIKLLFIDTNSPGFHEDLYNSIDTGDIIIEKSPDHYFLKAKNYSSCIICDPYEMMMADLINKPGTPLTEESALILDIKLKVLKRWKLTIIREHLFILLRDDSNKTIIQIARQLQNQFFLNACFNLFVGTNDQLKLSSGFGSDLILIFSTSATSDLLWRFALAFAFKQKAIDESISQTTHWDKGRIYPNDSWGRQHFSIFKPISLLTIAVLLNLPELASYTLEGLPSKQKKALLTIKTYNFSTEAKQLFLYEKREFTLLDLAAGLNSQLMIEFLCAASRSYLNIRHMADSLSLILHWAIDHASPDWVNNFMKTYKPVSTVREYLKGISPLIAAINTGNLAMVEVLVENGESICGDSFIPLHRGYSPYTCNPNTLRLAVQNHPAIAQYLSSVTLFPILQQPGRRVSHRSNSVADTSPITRF